jgi:UDP-N-acetylglucosamine 2-epimerase
MLKRLEPVVAAARPVGVMVYGDTNSTLAGALVAAKLGIPVAHVEAGLRSFDRTMPEEINRVVADHVSEVLLAPTTTAVKNLANEGISRGVHHSGDVMCDAIRMVEARLPPPKATPRSYLVATIHRAANTDDPGRLSAIVEALGRLPLPVVFPVHPRTRERLGDVGGRIQMVPPVGYLEMLGLQRHARCVVTDSGGMQKEACLLGTPCVTLRETTEWPETIDTGWNQLASPAELLGAVERARAGHRSLEHESGRGDAAERIVGVLTRSWSS